MHVRSQRSPSGKPLQTLLRGLSVLEAIARKPGHITARELSEQLGIGQGICYHLLRTLEEGGYVLRLPKGRYDLNGRVSFLQDSARSHLTPDLEILSILRDLHETVEETTAVCGWHRQSIVVQWYLEPRQALHARSLEIGYDENPHARASVRAMLAYLPESEVRAYLACRSRPKLTQNTITEIDDLIIELRRVAAAGYAIDREELSRGICCVGAPYFDERGFPTGAYGASAPTDRFDDNYDRLLAAVSEAAHMASKTLGYLDKFPVPSPLLRHNHPMKGNRCPPTLPPT